MSYQCANNVNFERYVNWERLGISTPVSSWQGTASAASDAVTSIREDGIQGDGEFPKVYLKIY